jgi:phosphoribosyl 1,2-cyclic phosphate phosphodiesterase
MERQGLVRVHVVPDGDGVTLGDVCIQPFRLAEDYVYAFAVETAGKRVLIAPDELYGWSPPHWVRGMDLAILPMGVTEFDPFTRERRIAADHQILMREATFADTLGMVRMLGAKRVILTHIEEPDGLGHDDLQRLGAKLQEGGLPVEFAWDGMTVDV